MLCNSTTKINVYVKLCAVYPACLHAGVRDECLYTHSRIFLLLFRWSAGSPVVKQKANKKGEFPSFKLCVCVCMHA